MTPEERQRLEKLEQQMQDHYHNGVVGREVNLQNISGTIRTITVADQLAAAVAGKPKRLSDQILIDTTTGTKKLYIFDTIGGVWRSVTIA